MKYVYRSGSFGVPADVAGDALNEIRDKHGRLVPEVVVNEARDEDSPLHPAFEWDDSVAAQEHRKWQARSLIRSVRIVRDDDTTAPAFVNVIVEREQYYQSTDVVVRNPDEFDSAMRLLVGHLHASQRAVTDLETMLSRQRGRRKQKRLIKSVSDAVQTAVEGTNELRA